ncbi:MAG: hypothetical protein LUG60_14685 [Erysipelotrichaceae bacterium]|nr:hypothetical protein [Erysipelotrichaceae bacterium]
MNDIYSMLNKENPKANNINKRMPKEEYAKMMNENRKRLYDMSDVQVKKIAHDPSMYLDYLKMQANTDYTVFNTLLVMAQKPEATMLKDAAHWRTSKNYVKKGEKGIQIVEPKGEYTKNDGTTGINYAIKYVFDVSQVNGNVEHASNMQPNDILHGLLDDSGVQVKLSEMKSNYSVYYSSEDKIIYYCDNLTENELLNGFIRESCYLELESQYGNINRNRDSFIVESSAYILCKKLGVENSGQSLSNESAVYFSGMDAKEMKNELNVIKTIAYDVSNRMDRALYKRQEKPPKKRQEVR